MNLIQQANQITQRLSETTAPFLWKSVMIDALGDKAKAEKAIHAIEQAATKDGLTILGAHPKPLHELCVDFFERRVLPSEVKSLHDLLVSERKIMLAPPRGVPKAVVLLDATPIQQNASHGAINSDRESTLVALTSHIQGFSMDLAFLSDLADQLEEELAMVKAENEKLKKDLRVQEAASWG